MSFILNFFTLEVFMGFTAIVVGITQIIKLAPPEFTSNFPKTISWIVTSLVIGLTAYFTGADWSTAGGVAIAVGFAANGLYDVLRSLWVKLFGKK